MRWREFIAGARRGGGVAGGGAGAAGGGANRGPAGSSLSPVYFWRRGSNSLPILQFAVASLRSDFLPRVRLLGPAAS
jgi:hypothetical protein